MSLPFSEYSRDGKWIYFESDQVEFHRYGSGRLRVERRCR